METQYFESIHMHILEIYFMTRTNHKKAGREQKKLLTKSAYNIIYEFTVCSVRRGLHLQPPKPNTYIFFCKQSFTGAGSHPLVCV